MKPTICVDFDGVIHSYDWGWLNGEIYGEAVPGFFEWLESVRHYFTVVVYSTRSKTVEGRLKMSDWIYSKRDKWIAESPRTLIREPLDLQFASEKPAAVVIIDDRAIQFRGDWNSPGLSLEGLTNFKPWNMEK